MQAQARSLFISVWLVAAGVACGGVEAAMDEEAVAEAATAEGEESTSGGQDDEIIIKKTKSPGRECGTKACFHIKAKKNISHVFLDFGKCNVRHFKVLARTPFTDEFEDVTDRLKDHGGPCQELGLKYRFELRGPDRDEPHEDREAEVCVVFYDKISEVKIGAKAANECKARHFDSGRCERCSQPHD